MTRLRRILLALAAVVAGTVAPAAELHLRRTCACSRPLVSLGDVAEILAIDAAEAERLAKIELFPAPAAGSSRLVRASEVRDVLAQRGVDLRQIRFVGASSMWVQGGASPKLTEEATPANPVAQALAIEPVPVMNQIVVSLRPLQRGAVIRASDVQLQMAQDLADGIAANVEDVVGREVVRPIAAGAAIPLAHLQMPQLVQKNEVVTVFARARGVQVRTSAKALEPGAKDDIIALESLLDRNAQFTARVIGHKEVEIFAGTPQISQPPTNTPAPVVEPSRSRGSLFDLRVRNSGDASATGR